jgi:hypothetical protein
MEAAELGLFGGCMLDLGQVMRALDQVEAALELELLKIPMLEAAWVGPLDFRLPRPEFLRVKLLSEPERERGGAARWLC